MLVWTGASADLESDTQHEPAATRHVQVLLPAVILLLQHDRRVTYRTLKDIFSLDDRLLADLRQELAFKRLAVDEDGAGLVWTGDAPPGAPTGAPPSPPAASMTSTSPAFHQITPATTVNEAPIVDASVTPEVARSSPEAERRQLTAMFCDLADSTKLSQWPMSCSPR
jgi:hypothetical protein